MPNNNAREKLRCQFDFSQGAPDFPSLEKSVLAFWDEAAIFEQSLAKNLDQPTYVFYDGPPFATGLPHYGHLLASTIKDLIPRYQTMKGRNVPRRWGWDCHGLPVENLIEKELNLNGKPEIEAYGVAKFNEACRAKVLEYRDEWQQVIHRYGRFVDMEHDYRTMDRDYMESVWWVFKQLFDRDLIYHDFKIMQYCPRCGTPLSNFEVTQNYQELKDLTVTAEFWLAEDEQFERLFGQLGLDSKSRVAALAWTTTPWTLPGNELLAVQPTMSYLLIKGQELNAAGQADYFLVGRELAAVVFGQEITNLEIVTELTGEQLVGLTYQPIFPYFSSEIKAAHGFRIVAGEFVTADEGTGIVHIAPAFGEDDYELGKREKLPLIQHVDKEANFTQAVTDFAGQPAKPKANPSAADIEIVKYLAAHDALFSKLKHTHSYPFCWRCDTPLLNYATDSWFVKVTTLKEQLLANNEAINWLPAHIKHGRFGKWLEGARDWAISRNRYWGTPLPIWQSEESGRYLCVGSVEELEKLTGQTGITDLHKHLIDDLVIYHDGETYHRIPEVLDCWFESGSMPYAQNHYPFEHKAEFEQSFPAEFISEGQDQTRGWFYTLHILATALTLPLNNLPPAIELAKSQPAFKNCVMSGIILAEDGKKMSKKLKNYPDPEELFARVGVDAVRLYLMQSPVVKGETLNFSEKEVMDLRRRCLIIWWNCLAFYQEVRDIPGETEVDPQQLERHILDQWLIDLTQDLVNKSTTALGQYDLNQYCRVVLSFVDDLSTWYLRLSRERLREQTIAAQDARAHFSQSLLILSKVMAPLVPFFAEVAYQALATDEQPVSVHLTDWPIISTTDSSLLLTEMKQIRQIVEAGHAARQRAKVKLRQPLAKAIITTDLQLEHQTALADLLSQELNVKAIDWQLQDRHETRVDFDWQLTPELEAEGQARELMRAIAGARKKQGLATTEQFFYEVESIPAGWQETIERKTNTVLSVVGVPGND